MTGPSVNIVLRLDQSKIKDDAAASNKALKSALTSVAGGFVLAGAAAKGLAEGAKFAFEALRDVSSQTGGFQAFEAQLTRTGGALGAAADRSGALRSAFKVGEDAARDFTAYLSSPAGRGAVNDFFAGVVNLGAGAIDTLVGMYKASVDLFRYVEQKANYLQNGVSVESTALDGDYGAAADRATKLAEDLRRAAKTGVANRGTFVDEKAAAAQRKTAEDFEKAVNASLARAVAARDAAFRAQSTALDARRQAAESERQIEEQRTQIVADNAARREDIRFDELKNSLNFDEELHKSAKAYDLNAAQSAKTFELKWNTIKDVTSAGISSVGMAAGQAIAGQGDFGELFAQMFGGAVAAQGALLIIEGSVALAANGLATFFPLIAAALGVVPGLGVPAALGAIGLGTTLLAGGGLIASIASGGPGALSGSGRGGGAGGGGGRAAAPPAARTPEGFQAERTTSAAPTVVQNVYNFTGPIGGSPRRIARGIDDARRGTTAPGGGGR